MATLSLGGRSTALPRDVVLSRLGRLPPQFLIGGVILGGFLIVAITGPFWAPYNPITTGTARPFAQVSPQHLFGTDQLGRDVFTRVVYGTRADLFLALASTLVGMLLGGSLGLLSGYVGGWFDQLLMRLLEVLTSIPLLILVLLIVSAVGPELSGNLVLLVGIVGVTYMPKTARMARAMALDLVTRDFVTVARARGESAWSIVRRELAPNAAGVLLVEFGVRAGYAPILISSLSFLGFGVRPPTPEWGLIISETRSAVVTAPIVVLSPALALALLVISLNLFTDGLARVLGRSVQHGPF